MPALAVVVVLAMAASPPPVYAALGDSTGVGVGARQGGGYPARLSRRLAADGLPVRLENLCVSGARVEDVVAGQLGAAVRLHPDVVTLGIGINDVTNGTDPGEFARHYARLAEALASTGARVVALNVPDLSLSPLAQGDAARRRIRDRVVAVNDVIAAEARLRGFALVDLFSATEHELAYRPGLLSEDRFHPSDQGYERWADLVQPALTAALAAWQAARGATLSTKPALR